jgi:CheY-like chemotaxis protein
MPVCNGLDATKAIRKIEGEVIPHIPIIAVTASVADEPICSQAGMDDFIPKPISKTTFLAKVEKWTKPS